jgi:hypothetical protein
VFSLAILGLSRQSVAQPSNVAQAMPDRSQSVKISDEASIEELIDQRIKEELAKGGRNFQPEMVQTEANYVRLSAASKDVLYESSFHLQPHYFTNTTTGPDTSLHRYADQPIMYYVGTARTPLALPVVSNLSKPLPSDEASYTVNIGVLPLPPLSSMSKDSGASSSDSMRYYIVIERTLESNHTDNSVRMEQFHKDCSSKIGEPVNMRLANERLTRGVVVTLENGTNLDFDDDFSRFIEEHILLASDRLTFKLGHQTVSDISERLSIPYSVASTSIAKVELLSVVDTAHPITIIDTLRQPADYLAEVDLSKFANGPYRYRYSAMEPGTGKILFTETHDFNKTSQITVNEGLRMGGAADTLVVGRKKVNLDSLLSLKEEELANEMVINDRITGTLDDSKKENQDLEQDVLANKKNTIADVHGRFGIGSGTAAGDNFFIGIESNRPALSFDVSFGWLYVTAPYLITTPPLINKFFTASKSLGFQLQWIPIKLLNGWIEPLVGIAYYGLWASGQNDLSSVALLSGQIGIACEPFGEVHGVGFSLSYGSAFGLGLSPASVGDLSFKAYVRF